MAESYTSLRGGPELESGSLTLKPTLSTTKPQNRLSVYPYFERISKLKFKLSQEMKPPPHHAPSLFVIGFEDACALSHAPTSPPFPVTLCDRLWRRMRAQSCTAPPFPLFVIGFEDACALSCGPMHCSYQAPLSTGILRQEYWSWFPLPSLRDLPDPGIKLVSPVLAGGFFTTEPPVKPQALKRHTSKQLNMCTCLQESHS